MSELRAFIENIGPAIAGLDFVPLLLALVCGGAIGFERELSGRAAGLRTHILVCLSSTLLILASRSGAGSFTDMDSELRLIFDPNRMAAGIVTGIGFLGAATVLRSGDSLRGLTTAACIWFVAGLGIVIGNEQYALAIVGTLAVLSVLALMNRFAGLLRPNIYRRLIVITTATKVQPQVDAIRAVLKSHEIRVMDLASSQSNETGHRELIFYIGLKRSFLAPLVTEEVGDFKGVLSVRWKQSEH
jgi:putative Mg2+ transporter-C (MgtC) family protein